MLESLWDLVFPPKCPFCGRWQPRGTVLCETCRRELPWLSGAAGEKAVELTRGCVASLRYDDRVRAAVHAYKFQGKSGRAEALGKYVARSVMDRGWDGEVELVSWPPLSRARLRQRGYDQAELLARSVARELGLPPVRTLDKREVPQQSTLEDEAARRANVLGAYTARRPEKLRGRRVLLVDDVVTTGATLSECAKVLRLAGVEEVFCAVLARAR